jgi:hypothetical protein
VSKQYNKQAQRHTNKTKNQPHIGDFRGDDWVHCLLVHPPKTSISIIIHIMQSVEC